MSEPDLDGPSSDAVRAGRATEDAMNTTTGPVPRRELWSYADIARYTGVRPATLRSYRHRGLMPAPDIHPSADQPRWYPDTIIVWHAARPGRGARTDLTRRPDNRGSACP